MISKKTLQAAKHHKNELLILGVLLLPIGLGLVFLLMYVNMREHIRLYERAEESKKNPDKPLTDDELDAIKRIVN